MTLNIVVVTKALDFLCLAEVRCSHFCSRKAFGPASIPNNFLKLFKNELSTPISLLANISFNTLMFPNILKTANVTPIFKNDDPALCNNYRPISLLSNISKIFEKIVHARLSEHFSQQTMFSMRNNLAFETNTQPVML